jgi:hypothetical protein
MPFFEYEGRRIEVVAAELADGGFGILRLTVWDHHGASERITTLPVVEPHTFSSEEEAQRAGLTLAVRAINAGTV